MTIKKKCAISFLVISVIGGYVGASIANGWLVVAQGVGIVLGLAGWILAAIWALSVIFDDVY